MQRATRSPADSDNRDVPPNFSAHVSQCEESLIPLSPDGFAPFRVPLNPTVLVSGLLHGTSSEMCRQDHWTPGTRCQTEVENDHDKLRFTCERSQGAWFIQIDHSYVRPPTEFSSCLTRDWR